MVCDKVVCQRWGVTKLCVCVCVKDGVSKMVGDKVVCERRWMSPSATPATQNEGRCLQVPRLPRETKVDVTKCHACRAK